ncbi:MULTISPECIES: S-layer homology domain-containing protein [unclassified Sedimentibacter]|uniref:S-layer homology domain-containing protein n=1 Tax=unclassified Sedimentibacter TaxID=2649220 RepID=UPI0027E1782E|nr:S-layer homology domain-containing protein [Sedimentibacter sp. MB35-C1]WMJ76066.1 S-layer homology domain-containing protein [Sedimentibacter sp. MB35-C1]
MKPLTMELELNITDNGNTINGSQRLGIENFLEDQSIAMYLDIELKLKNITNNTETLLVNTQNPVKIKIEIPSNMRRGRDYKIIRLHKGVIEILDTVLEGNYLVFETDRFSQYALSYKTYNEKDESDKSTKALENHIAYIKGYEDETFRPENNITRAEAAESSTK